MFTIDIHGKFQLFFLVSNINFIMHVYIRKRLELSDSLITMIIHAKKSKICTLYICALHGNIPS